MQEIWIIFTCNDNDFSTFCATQSNAKFLRVSPDHLRELTSLENSPWLYIPNELLCLIIPRSKMNQLIRQSLIEEFE